MFFGRCFVLIVVYTCFFVGLQAQEDLSRNNDLPSRIGGPSCSNLGRREGTTISGSFHVTGSVPAGSTPRFSVAVYAGGTFIGRQRVKNGGSFIFYCVPRDNATLVGEVDMVEVGTFSMGTLAPAPGINRQDVYINNYSGQPKASPRNEVISARVAYERNKETQKQFDRALEEIQSNDSASAEKRLTKLLKDDPKDFAAWNIVGSIHFNNNKFDEAVEAFERSLELKPDFLPAMTGMGRAFLGMKKFDEAIEILTKACTLEPNSADANHYLGEAYLQIKKGSLGIPYLNTAIKIAPDQKAELHLRMATLYKNAGAKHLAANEYKLFLQKRPNYPDKQKMEAYISENSQ